MLIAKKTFTGETLLKALPISRKIAVQADVDIAISFLNSSSGAYDPPETLEAPGGIVQTRGHTAKVTADGEANIVVRYA
jgi:hypothetical protein